MKLPNYKDSILNVSASLMKYYHINTALDSLEILDQELKQPYNHIVLMLFDGLGKNVIDRYIKDDDLFKKHYLRTLTSVFPSTTVAATMALLTGKTPNENGLLGWFHYVEKDDIYYMVFLRKDYYDENKVIPYELHDTFLRKTFLDEINSSNQGVKAQIFYPTPVDKNGFSTLDEGLNRLNKFHQEHAQTFSYFYVTEPDLSIHEHGIQSEITKEKVQLINEGLTKYYQTLPKDTLVIIIADHGLLDVKPLPLLTNKPLCDTFLRLPALEARATTFYIKEGQKEIFEHEFNKAYGAWFILYDKETFLKSGLLGPGIMHPLTESSIGDYIGIGIDRYYFSLTNDFTFKGHHAGLTKDEMEVPFILLRGGEVR